MNLKTLAVQAELASRSTASAGVLTPGKYTNAQVVVDQDGNVTEVKDSPRSTGTNVVTTQNFPGNVLGTRYYNNTGHALFVNLSGHNPGGPGTNGDLTLSCGPHGGGLIPIAKQSSDNSAGSSHVCGIIPAGYDYQGDGAGSFGGSMVLDIWVENPLTVG